MENTYFLSRSVMLRGIVFILFLHEHFQSNNHQSSIWVIKMKIIQQLRPFLHS